MCSSGLPNARSKLGALERARELVHMIRRRASTDGFVKNPDGSNALITAGILYTCPDGKEAARKSVPFEERLEFAGRPPFLDLVRWLAKRADCVVDKRS